MIIVGKQKAEPVTTSVSVGMSAAEKRRITAAAKAAGLTVSAFGRRELLASATRMGK